MRSDESETVDDEVVAAARSCNFGVDSRGILDRPLEGLSMKGQRNCNQLASTNEQSIAMKAS